MANFKGFSTINKHKKFSLTDRELIKRDLQNAFSIRQGQMPGRPEVGSRIWDYVLDPNDTVTRNAIEQEITRIISLDSRIELIEIRMTYAENNINVYVSVNLLPNANTEEFYLTFLLDSQTINIR